MTSSRRGRGTCSSASRAREGARVSSPPFWLCVGLDSQKTKKTRGRRSSTARIEPVRGQTVPHLFSPLVKKTKKPVDRRRLESAQGSQVSTQRHGGGRWIQPQHSSPGVEPKRSESVLPPYHPFGR